MIKDFAIDTALDWQRNKATKTIGIIESKNKWYTSNVTKFFNDWYTDIFNLDTANDFGLTVWANILDIPLLYEGSGQSPDFRAFGVGNDITHTGSWNFLNDGFGVGGSKSGYAFSVEQKRMALKLKAYIISMSGSIKEINEALARIMGKGKLWVHDNFNMSISYYAVDDNIKTFALVLKDMNLLPRPAAVLIDDVHSPNGDAFGFGEKNRNFDRGIFKKS